ncbi:hypothetical protein LCGC14_3119060, partial [marine sediment metagenome]
NLDFLDSGGSSLVSYLTSLGTGQPYTTIAIDGKTAPALTAEIRITITHRKNTGSGSHDTYWDSAVVCICDPAPTFASVGALQKALNPGFEFINEGLGDRVSVALNPTATNVAWTKVSWIVAPPLIGSSVSISLDNGGSFTGVVNGDPIPGVSVGDDISSIDLKTRVILSSATQEDTASMDSLIVLIADISEVELHYILITLPSLTIDDSSPNNLDGIMSYPLAPVSITTSQDALVSTGVIVSKQSQTMSPDVVSEVDPGGWQGGNFDPSNLPFNQLCKRLFNVLTDSFNHVDGDGIPEKPVPLIIGEPFGPIIFKPLNALALDGSESTQFTR